MFGERLKELREERGISLMVLAKAIGVSDTAVCKWENNVSEPKLSYIVRLADYFECSADYLTGRTDEYNGEKGSVDKAAQQILTIYREMPQDVRELVFDTMRLWKKKHTGQE